MNRLTFLLLSGLVLSTSPGITGTNPFAEEVIKVEQSVTDTSVKEGKVVQTSETTVAQEDITRAIAKLEEASNNYSKLLRKFADDPQKFANENGDYRDFIKQLELLSKRLSELSQKLKKISDGLKNKEKPVAKPKAEDPKIIDGVVKVGTSLNVRTSPWGKIIGSLHDNDKVKITGKSGDWYKISYNGKTAFVHSNYVETAEKKAGVTPVKQGNQGNDNAAPANNSSARGGGLTSAPCQPMPSRASSEYGWRIHPTLHTRRFHDGIDLPVPTGTRLNALGNGTVIAVGYESGGGRYIKVRYDNGYESFYCHLQSYSAKKGQRVSAGQAIARSDNTGTYTTGAHLHFALKKNGKSVNPRSAGIPLPR